jgi:hypothetical protein
MAPPQTPENRHSPYVEALESLIGELEDAQKEAGIKRIELSVAEAGLNQLAQLARQLVEKAPPEDRAQYRHRIASFIQSIGRGSRGATAIYKSILDLLASEPGRVWSAAEARAALQAKGIPSDAEQIHNIFQYLARKDRVERSGPGRYRLADKQVA